MNSNVWWLYCTTTWQVYFRGDYFPICQHPTSNKLRTKQVCQYLGFQTGVTQTVLKATQQRGIRVEKCSLNQSLQECLESKSSLSSVNTKCFKMHVTCSGPRKYKLYPGFVSGNVAAWLSVYFCLSAFRVDVSIHTRYHVAHEFTDSHVCERFSCNDRTLNSCVVICVSIRRSLTKPQWRRRCHRGRSCDNFVAADCGSRRCCLVFLLSQKKTRKCGPW